MWEDTFTGVFKFRARWLVLRSDIPHESLLILTEARRASGRTNVDQSVSGDSSSEDDPNDVEVFLTSKKEDLELRLVIKPITLSVISKAIADIPPEWKAKTGPRLTHAYDDSKDEFVLLEHSHVILRRARARQSEAVAIASRADQEQEAARNGKPISKSNGWLLPKGSAFGTRKKGKGPDCKPGGGSGRRRPTTRMLDLDCSEKSESEEAVNAKDVERGAVGNGDGETTDSDMDPIVARTTLGDEKKNTPRKSARQGQSLRTPNRDIEVESRAGIPVAASMPQRRSLAPQTKRHGNRPPRPRRLAMPPMAVVENTGAVTAAKGGPPTAVTFPPTATIAARLARTRMAKGARSKSSLNSSPSSSKDSAGNSVREASASGKRKKTTAKAATSDESEYPPRRTPVGKDYQVDIPELLSADERKSPAVGTGARMVSRTTNSLSLTRLHVPVGN